MERESASHLSHDWQWRLQSSHAAQRSSTFRAAALAPPDILARSPTPGTDAHYPLAMPGNKVQTLKKLQSRKSGITGGQIHPNSRRAKQLQRIELRTKKLEVKSKVRRSNEIGRSELAPACHDLQSGVDPPRVASRPTCLLCARPSGRPQLGVAPRAAPDPPGLHRAQRRRSCRAQEGARGPRVAQGRGQEQARGGTRQAARGRRERVPKRLWCVPVLAAARSRSADHLRLRVQCSRT